MMNCKKTEKELLAFHGKNEISNDTLEHIKQCHSCGLLFEKTKIFYEGLEAEKAFRSSPFMATRIMAAIDEKEYNPTIQFRMKKGLQMAFVATALVLGIFSSMLFNNANSTPENNPVLADYFFTENTGIEQQWLNFDNYEIE